MAPHNWLLEKKRKLHVLLRTHKKLRRNFFQPRDVLLLNVSGEMKTSVWTQKGVEWLTQKRDSVLHLFVFHRSTKGPTAASRSEERKIKNSFSNRFPIRVDRHNLNTISSCVVTFLLVLFFYVNHRASPWLEKDIFPLAFPSSFPFQLSVIFSISRLMSPGKERVFFQKV